jgi:hypothetical protein
VLLAFPFAAIAYNSRSWAEAPYEQKPAAVKRMPLFSMCTGYNVPVMDSEKDYIG